MITEQAKLGKLENEMKQLAHRYPDYLGADGIKSNVKGKRQQLPEPWAARNYHNHAPH